jgi:hypothetical protein
MSLLATPSSTSAHVYHGPLFGHVGMRTHAASVRASLSRGSCDALAG